MWVFTKVGFFSATEIPDGRIQVRARVRRDLEKLKKTYLPTMGKIKATPRNDYPYRAFVTKDEWAGALWEIGRDIDYNNFKDEIFYTDGIARELVYHKVWAALLALETPITKGKKNGKRATDYATNESVEQWWARVSKESSDLDRDAS